MGYAEIVEGAERSSRTEAAPRQDQIQSAALAGDSFMSVYSRKRCCSIAKTRQQAAKRRTKSKSKCSNRGKMRREGRGGEGSAIDMATMRVEMKSAHGQTIKIITGSCDQWKRHCNGNGYSNGLARGWVREMRRGEDC